MHAARQADAIETPIRNTPQLTVRPLGGPRLPADQSEQNHVDAGDDGSIPEAEALAFAMGVEKHANAHPACADSYSFNSKNACFQARSHPRPPATVAGLNQTNGTRHARPFPSFPRRQSRHCWPLRGLLYCLESRAPAPQPLCCAAGGPQSPLKETHHEADADQRHAARRTPPGHR